MKLLLRRMSPEVAPFGSVAQFPRCLQIDLKRASRQGPCWSENEPDPDLALLQFSCRIQEFRNDRAFT